MEAMEVRNPPPELRRRSGRGTILQAQALDDFRRTLQSSRQVLWPESDPLYAVLPLAPLHPHRRGEHAREQNGRGLKTQLGPTMCRRIGTVGPRSRLWEKVQQVLFRKNHGRTAR